MPSVSFFATHVLCVERALVELKEAHKSQDIASIDSAMEKINGGW
jgi:hypothetical protein